VQGCVFQSSDGRTGNLYVAGWMKTGPKGVIATTMMDARFVVARLLADLRERGANTGIRSSVIENALTVAGVRVVSFSDWLKIEAEESRRGAAAGKIATKITDVSEMFNICNAP